MTRNHIPDQIPTNQTKRQFDPFYPDDDLVPQQYLDMLNMEQMLHPDEIGNEEKTARRIMRQSLPHVSTMLVRTALNDIDPRVRISAANVILDRTLGKSGTTHVEDTSPQENLFMSMITDIETMLQDQSVTPNTPHTPQKAAEN